MKKILLIGTGGTIASCKTPDGLQPGLQIQALLDHVPEVKAFCTVDAQEPFSIDSTNLQPTHWLKLVACIRAQYEAYDGFVICHGTDTMAYTAAALSYLIRDPDKPVVLTGAQKPIEHPETDARVNLLDSFRWACMGYGGVCIVFGGHVLAGTRARKVRTRSARAFASLDFPELAVTRGERIIPFFPKSQTCGPAFYETLDPHVAVLKLTPGLPPESFAAFGERCDGLVIESYGMGGIPAVYEEALERLCAAGKTVVVGTQVPQEGSDLSVYQVGRSVLRKYNLLETADMTVEAAVTKLMWVLGQTRDPAEIRRLFQTEINHDRLIRPGGCATHS